MKHRVFSISCVAATLFLLLAQFTSDVKSANAIYFDDFSSYQLGASPSGWTQYGTSSITPIIVNYGGSGLFFQRLEFPAYIAQSTNKAIIKDGLSGTFLTATVKLNFQTSSDGAGLIVAWKDSSNYIAVLPNPFWDEIVVWEFVDGEIRSTTNHGGRYSVPINPNRDYWLRVVTSQNGASVNQLDVYWSTDGTTFLKKDTAINLVNITGQVGLGSFQFLSRVLFDDFTIEDDSVTPTMDLSISKDNIKPIQVVEGANVDGGDNIDLVLNKPTVIRVRPTITYVNPVDLGKELVVTLTFQGQSLPINSTIGAVLGNPNFFIDFFVTPHITGESEILVTLDPDNTIIETDETNNQNSGPDNRVMVSVKKTSSMRLVYLPVTIPSPLSSYQETIDNGGVFTNAVFPLNPDLTNIVRTISTEEVKTNVLTGLPYIGIDPLYLDVFLRGKRIDGYADRIVAIIPNGFTKHYFPFSNNSGGFSYGEGDPIIWVQENNWIGEAHELAHTLGLHDKPQGSPNTNGYWVELKMPVENMVDFMAPGELFSWEQWISPEEYNHLFERLRIDKTDPKVLLVTGTLSSSDQLEFYKFYQIDQGVIDDKSGDYNLQLLDIYGNLVNTTHFDVSFYIEDLDVVVDKAPFAFAIEYPGNSVTVKVEHNGIVLGQTNIHSQLLRDAINAIPNSGFEKNASQRRTALLNKVDAVEKQIMAGNIQGAVNKLENDLRKHLDSWLLDNYPTQSSLDYSKQEILSLVDGEIERITNLK